MNGREWREFVQELKQRWSILWRHRIDDKVRAEGIASKDYEAPNLGQSLERHAEDKLPDRVVAPNPAVGGWSKFIRDVISKQERFTKSGRPIPPKPKKERQQPKKGGKGWLHVKMR